MSWVRKRLRPNDLRRLERHLPKPLRSRLARAWRSALPFLYRGDAVSCPCCCGHFREFMPAWNRPNAICPRCYVSERHRAVWLYLDERRRDLLSRSLSLLHFAPEEPLARRLAAIPNVDYLSADLDSELAMTHFDITDIPYADDSFGALLCSHVLEHVPDDRKAMRELFRVLEPGGWALVMVPLDEGRAVTYEDSAIETPAEREQAYWQDDHLRLYGRDFAGRLAEAGFEVDADEWVRTLDDRTIARYGLAPETVFVATKPQAQKGRAT